MAEVEEESDTKIREKGGKKKSGHIRTYVAFIITLDFILNGEF
jgi:hypothetical protein